eukprot:2185978-Pyramimonas_sp.AAC.1
MGRCNMAPPSRMERVFISSSAGGWRKVGGSNPRPSPPAAARRRAAEVKGASSRDEDVFGFRVCEISHVPIGR